MSATPQPSVRGTLLASVIVLVGALPATAADGLPTAAQWRGKYPFDGKPNFYQNAALREAAMALIGGKRFKQMLVGWTTVTPIETDGETLMAFGCKPHDCADHNQTTLIEGGQVMICLNQGGVVTWYGPNRRAATPHKGSPAPTPAGDRGCSFASVREARQAWAAAR